MQRVRATVSAVYRHAPIPLWLKLRIKDIIFVVFGFTLNRTDAYRRWHMQRQLQRELFRLDGAARDFGYDRASSDRHNYTALKEAIATARRRRAAEAVVSKSRPAMPQPARTGTPSGSDPEISILVLGSSDRLRECLRSLGEQMSGAPSFEIIVAMDADSVDTTSSMPPFRFTALAGARGPVDACNGAAALAHGRFLLLVDSDARIGEGGLDALFDEACNTTDIGMAGPMVVRADGRLFAAGAYLRYDGSMVRIGDGERPDLPQYAHGRDVDHCPHPCVLVRRSLFDSLGGLDPAYASLPYAVADLGLKAARAGYRSRYCPDSRVVCYGEGDGPDSSASLRDAARDQLHLLRGWQDELDRRDSVRMLAFYLPQFHPIPENDLWWGKGFTEWTNVAKAVPNFSDHYQPRRPADLGYYDLRVPEVLAQQVELARRYGIGGFCYYYYWFHGKRLLERPIERILQDDRYDFPFCLCWANENWTRRWDGKESDILIGQAHSDQDDRDVIADIARFFAHPAYIRIRGRPLVLIYRTELFPDFARTAGIWREACREAGIGEIFIARMETGGRAQPDPARCGCDAAVGFPPHALDDMRRLDTGSRDPAFNGFVVDYRGAALQYASAPPPQYKRFPGVMPGWDNTARRQKDGACFHRASPGAFRAWLESQIQLCKQQLAGDERLVFINAWNEWAEGAYLEPDHRHGHAYLQAVADAFDADRLTERR